MSNDGYLRHYPGHIAVLLKGTIGFSLLFLKKINCIKEIAKDAKVIEIDDQLLVLIKRQLDTKLMLAEKFRDLCEEVSNFVKEIEDVVKEVERLSCKDVANETLRLLRRGQ
ncbi:hypothetical protein Tco_0716828 [Tanacetum coccineum]